MKHTSHWTVECASKIKKTRGTVFPPFEPKKISRLIDDQHVWDSWVVLNEDGTVADFDGHQLLIALTRPCDPAKAHTGDGEKIGVFETSDGENYRYLGNLFETPLYDDVREWSGSTIKRRDGRLQTFYTIANGVNPYGVWQTNQRFATAIQDVEVIDSKVKIFPPVYHDLLAEPDGMLYQTAQQAAAEEAKYPTRHIVVNGDSQTDNFCFRDPKFFLDSETGRTYLFFEANTGAEYCAGGVVHQRYLGSHAEYRPTPDDLKANGCVGVMELKTQDYTFGVFRKPWLTTNLVTDEIERINVIRCGGKICLFVDGHGNKNSLASRKPELVNFDYMLGFVADEVGGGLTPMNGAGLVIGQKSMGDMYAGQDQNMQYTYSWLLVPTDIERCFRCISYANYSKNKNGEFEPVKTAGPTLIVQLSQDCLSSEIIGMRYDIQLA